MQTKVVALPTRHKRITQMIRVLKKLEDNYIKEFLRDSDDIFINMFFTRIDQGVLNRLGMHFLSKKNDDPNFGKFMEKLRIHGKKILKHGTPGQIRMLIRNTRLLEFWESLFAELESQELKKILHSIIEKIKILDRIQDDLLQRLLFTPESLSENILTQDEENLFLIELTKRASTHPSSLHSIIQKTISDSKKNSDYKKSVDLINALVASVSENLVDAFSCNHNLEEIEANIDEHAVQRIFDEGKMKALAIFREKLQQKKKIKDELDSNKVVSILGKQKNKLK